MRALALLAVLLLAPLTDAFAQEHPLHGEKIRVRYGMNRTRKGWLDDVRRDTLVFIKQPELNLPLSDVKQLAVYRGEGFTVGTVVIGGLVGMAGGALLHPLAALPAGVIGAGLGALVKSSRWEVVPLDRLQVSVVPTRRGFGLGVSIAF